MKNVLKNIANTPRVEVFPLRTRKVDTIIVSCYHMSLEVDVEFSFERAKFTIKRYGWLMHTLHVHLQVIFFCGGKVALLTI